MRLFPLAHSREGWVPDCTDPAPRFVYPLQDPFDIALEQALGATELPRLPGDEIIAAARFTNVSKGLLLGHKRAFHNKCGIGFYVWKTDTLTALKVSELGYDALLGTFTRDPDFPKFPETVYRSLRVGLRNARVQTNDEAVFSLLGAFIELLGEEVAA